MKIYKVLNKDLKSPFRKFQFELGKEYICKDFDDNPLNDCSNGFYATPTIEGCLYTNISNNKIIVEGKAFGKSVFADKIFKIRHEKLILRRVLPESEIRLLAKKEGLKRGYNIEKALYPINPLNLIFNNKITDKHVELLKQWALVRASVRDSVWVSVWGSVWGSVGDSIRASARGSVWGSVRDSVRDSVRGSVWDSVRDSIRDSVGGSVWGSAWDSAWDSIKAYIGSLFLNIKKWKYIKHKENKYPFQSAVDLWKMGLIPIYYNNKWQLHAGKKAKIITVIKFDN